MQLDDGRWDFGPGSDEHGRSTVGSVQKYCEMKPKWRSTLN